MDDHDEIQLDQLALDEIAELLEELGADMSPEQLQQTARFVQQLGGIEAAMAAIEHLHGKAA